MKTKKKAKMQNSFKLFSTPFISYCKRIISTNINWGTFYFIFLLFLFRTNKIVILVVLLFWIYYFINNLYEARVYITKIVVYENEIEIYYFFKNTGANKLVLLKDSFSIDWIDSVKGSFKGGRIIIQSNEKKLIQYSVGKWNRKTFKKVINNLKNEYPPATASL